MEQSELDNKNAEYWTEPCGTQRANRLELNLNNSEDLKSFDDWYFRFYPYLKHYLKDVIDRGEVLEVGIGLGTVSRFLATKVAHLDLVDIAPGAISFTKKSLHNSINVNYFTQSILDFKPTKKYDSIIALGSLHHTGQLENAISKLEQSLKPGGRILIMVYYAFQPRRLILSPVQCLNNYRKSKYKLTPSFIYRERYEWIRRKADSNSLGEAPPDTAFTSKKFFTQRPQMTYTVELNNTHRIPFTNRVINRNFLLKHFSRYIGCDIYAIGTRKFI
jgi:SAM-dependent methyltransferase